MPVMKEKRRHRDPVDAAKRVVATMYCVRCGSDLRGLSIEEGCPACKHSVYDSVYGGFLIDSSPFEARRINEMSNLVLYPALLMGALAAISLLVAAFTSQSAVGAIEATFDVGMLWGMLSAIVGIVGAVVFTGRYSVAYYAARFGNPRAIVGFTGVVICTIGIFFAVATYSPPVASALFQVMFIAVPGGAYLRGLTKLMARVPHKKLMVRSRVALWVLYFLCAAALAIQLLRPQAKTNSDLAGFLTALTLLTTLGTILFVYANLRLLLAVRRTLRAIQH